MSARQSFLIFSLIFAVSGFAGLIYESVWTHYLKLFLGHAAYAQVLVLAIFMGGLALGAWLASRMGARLKRLLLGYAAMEALIGLFGLVFHDAFTAIISVSYDSIIPALGNGVLITAFKWTLAALLILPQSILLGTTFPLMTAGLIRRFPHMAGYALAMLYFANSLGAAIGILVSGFVLIEAYGLPGTILIAGVLNLVVAAAVWLVAGNQADQAVERKPPREKPDRPHLGKAFLLAAFLTGTASFLYEVGWIRMLSLVLGSSTHAFELMLGTFILGLALGGLLVRRHVDHFKRPLLVLGGVQILMGILALLTLPLYNQTFDLMAFAVRNLASTDGGYLLYNLASHGIAMLVMLPATIMAGMTLPLMTHYLIRQGTGEQAIGHVYAANTIGAIVGVALGLGLLMPTLGVKSLIVGGGLVDILLGGGFLVWALRSRDWRWRTLRDLPLTGAAGAAAIGLVLVSSFDPVRMISGVFMHGRIDTSREVIYQRDGRTATVAVFQTPGHKAIVTNGKIDAGVSEHVVSKDVPTMTLLAGLPLALHPRAKNIAVIGMGSGMSSHMALGSPNVARVDTIEIEPAMIDGARLFGHRVERVFKDPRSHIHIEDAKAFFTQHGRRYDVIISEPSNPWVSGIAGLFSTEFYAHAARHLHDDGVFVQWLHIYSLNVDLVASVVKALSANFGDYAIYALNDTDLAIVAVKGNRVPRAKASVFQLRPLAADLAYVGVTNLQDFAHRLIGRRAYLQPYFESFALRPNSDYHPVLDLGAVRARFLGEDARELHRLRLLDAPLQEVLGDSRARMATTRLSRNYHLSTAARARQAMALRDALTGTPSDVAADADTLRLLRNLRAFQHQCEPQQYGGLWLRDLHELAELTLPWLNPTELQAVWQVYTQAPCRGEFSQAMRQWLALYQAIGRRDMKQAHRTALELLPRGRIPPSRSNNYLLTVALLGAIQANDLDAAGRLWQRYTNKRTRLVELRALRAWLASRWRRRQARG